jgi:hypothetical protein
LTNLNIMKKITVTVLIAVFAITLNAQDFSVKSTTERVAPEMSRNAQAILFDQSPDATLTNFESVVSTVINTGAGVYVTDDFTLNAGYDIQSITAFGFNSNQEFETTVTGINVYIYANSGTNTPNGSPSQIGSGLLELVNVDPDGPAVQITNTGDGGFNITVDIEAANGGLVSLPAGNYWLVVAPSQNIPDFTSAATRWNWKAAGSGAFGNSSAHLIDPTDAFGGGFTDWTLYYDLGLIVQSTAFIIEGELSGDAPPYCGPLVFGTVEPITNVEFAGIDNSTDASINGTPAHEDFTGLSGYVLAGGSYDIILEGNTDGPYTNRFAVFVDWNQNGVLNDAGEVYQITTTINGSTGVDGQQAIQTLAVPADAVIGQTRMRVKKIFGTADYLDPCLGTNFGQVEDYSISVSLFLARVQVVHNSPDPATSVVDVYLGSTLLIDDFEFRTATPFVDIPANQEITLSVAPGTSTDVSDALYSVDVTLVADETYIVVADGVLDPSQFDDSVNTIDFALQAFAGAREAAVTAGNTDVLVHHGSPDAPTVDVVNQDGGVILVDNIIYPQFQGYLELLTDDYLIDITTADNSVKVAGYRAYLAELGLEDAAVTVFASGFLNPAANQDGPAFGLWVSLASGGALVELNDEDFVLFPAPYCGPLVFGTVEPITNVEFAGIDNSTDASTGGTPAHEDFTGLSGDVLAGGSYDIILEGSTNGPTFTNRFAVFVDWNQNGVLNDAGEVYQITTTITGSTGIDGQQAIQTLAVPADAVIGQTRMRVKKIFGIVYYLDPCLGTSYGQVEDYTVNVAPSLSISTFDSADFTYYPNPVKGILSISIASTVDNIKVHNMLGQLVVETAPKVSNPQMDMNGLQPGLYLVTLEVEGSLQTFRVVKQ